MQIIKNKELVLFCTAILLCSFKVFAAEPVWVNSPYKVYSAEKFITGFGKGSTQEQAEISAIESLASTFGQDVKSSSKATKKMAQVQEGMKSIVGSSSSFSESIQRKVLVEDLIGVKIAERYSESGKFYALAIMDKGEAKTMLSSSIVNNNTRVESLLKIDSDDENSLETYSQLDLASQICALNDKLLKKLDVVDASQSSILKPKCKSEQSVRNQMNKIKSQIPIYIEIENDFENQVEQAFSQMVKGSGFNTSSNSDERYSIECSVSFVKRKPRDGTTVQCIYTLEGALIDNYIGERLMPINIQGRESSVDEADVVVRAYRAISSKIKTTVNSSFLVFLSSL